MTLTATRYRQVLIWLLVLGALLRVVGLNWDDGRGLHPDEGNLVRAALTLGLNGRILPEFHAYNDLALWLPRLLSLPFCTGQDASCLTLVARALSAALSLAIILPGAAVACRLGGANGSTDAGRIAGLAAAAALATSAPLVQWAHFGTTESALATLVILSWWLTLLWRDQRLTDRQMTIVSGVAIGVGFGFKTTALVVGIVPALALLMAPRPLLARGKMLAVFAIVTVLQSLAFAPSVFLSFENWLGVMHFESGVVTGRLAVFWTAQFHGTSDGTFELLQLWGMLSGAGLFLAFLGITLTPRAAWPLAAPALAFVVVYVSLTFGWQAKFVRYLAPLVPILLVFAGVVVGILARGSFGRTASAAAIASLGVLSLAGLDSASAYLRADPRLTVEKQLLALSAPGDLVAVEPRDLAQVGGRTQAVLPLTDETLSAQTLAAPLAQAKWLIIASRRNWAVLPRLPNSDPVICAFYAGLADGSLGYSLVSKTARSGLFGHLFAGGLKAEETRYVFDRPEVLLFRNVEPLSPADLANRLGQPRSAADCSGPELSKGWKRGA